MLTARLSPDSFPKSTSHGHAMNIPPQRVPVFATPETRQFIVGIWFSLVVVVATGTPSNRQIASASETDRRISFELDVQPILTSRGCNAGACHGKASGQNGFKLSLLAFDPDEDFEALTRQHRGRITFDAVPESSLMLMKASGRVPHGGGQRISPDELDYDVLRSWIRQGTPRKLPDEPELLSVTVEPDACVLKPQEMASLKVTAHYSDGSSRDVTSRTEFQSNEAATVRVDDQGVIAAGSLPGESAVMARYMNMIAACRVLIPLPEVVDREVYADLPRQNFIDDLVWEKLKLLNLTPSQPVDDARFLRRAHLDIIGRVPSPGEVRDFLGDTDPDKRHRLVDALLQRPEYVDHWASKWMDLLRPNPYRVGIKAVLNYDNWIREAFRENRPYDQFVYDLVTAEGSTYENGAVTFFRDRRSPDEVATMVSQLFLGIRLDCAKCHHHPFEKWSQHDFYSFAAYFARVGRKGTGLSPPISGSEEIIMASSRGSVTHPVSGETLSPKPLYGETSFDEQQNWREQLGKWLTSEENEYFAMVMVNRVWADMMGRGIVEPIDDLRATNPSSNDDLLKALAADFREHEFDLKHLIRTIATSYVYALSSTPNDRNVVDARNYSRHYRKQLPAEVMLDAVADVTGVATSFSGMPPESRANQLWTHRIPSNFLDTYGRPDENQDPPCERTSESTVTQVLHMMNDEDLNRRLKAESGRAAILADSDMSTDAMVEEVYLAIYNRFPTPDERLVGQGLFDREGRSRRESVEDLMWALLNTAEFMFQD